MEKTFGLQDRVTINAAGIVELDLETTLTTKNVGVVVGTFEDLTVGLPQEVDVDFGEEIGIIEAIPCEFLKEHEVIVYHPKAVRAYQPFVLRNKETLEKQVIRSTSEYARDKACNELRRKYPSPMITSPFNEKGISNIEVIINHRRRLHFELICI